jgi:hypothetical protein
MDDDDDALVCIPAVVLNWSGLHTMESHLKKCHLEKSHL